MRNYSTNSSRTARTQKSQLVCNAGSWSLFSTPSLYRLFYSFIQYKTLSHRKTRERKRKQTAGLLLWDTMMRELSN